VVTTLAGLSQGLPEAADRLRRFGDGDGVADRAAGRLWAGGQPGQEALPAPLSDLAVTEISRTSDGSRKN
jgi:hypothetical protein